MLKNSTSWTHRLGEWFAHRIWCIRRRPLIEHEWPRAEALERTRMARRAKS